MNARPRIGATGELTFVVDAQHAIQIAGAPALAVLSTPWLIWFLEQAARQAVSSALDPDTATVGVHVDVQHLAATPVGQQVACRARVVHVDGATISFQVEARDPHETIARGLHKRRVIRLDRFERHVQRKRRSGGPGMGQSESCGSG